MIVRSLAACLSPAGPAAKLSILTFHRVLASPDPLLPGEPDQARFDEELRWLGRWFRVLPLDEAARRLAEGSLPARAAAITFDDGYANNAEQALPILQRHRMPATFFIATGFLDGGRMWNDSVIETVRACAKPALEVAGLGRVELGQPAERRQAIDKLLGHFKYLSPEQRSEQVVALAEQAAVRLPDNLMMRSNQVQALHRAGMQIGAHTCSHPILTRLDDGVARREIADSKARLESLLDAQVALFAYPNGVPGRDYAPRHAAMLREAGFLAAVSTAPGTARHGDDLFQLPRFKPWDRSALRYGLRMVNNLRATAVLAT